MGKENGNSVAYKDPYSLSYQWDPKKVIIHPRFATLQESRGLGRVEILRPVDSQVLTDSLFQAGIPARVAQELTNRVRESLSEL